MAIVYVAVNLINDKIYVGATEKELRERQWKHIANANRGQKSKFYSAIRKYGKDKFKFLVIHQCSDFFEALDYERIYIASLKPEYNMTSGGGGVKGLKFSDESRQKMSAAKLGRPAAWLTSGEDTSEIRRKISEATRSRLAGIKITDPDELAWRRRAAALANEARRREVVCLNTGKIFDSVTDAAKSNGLSTSHITNYCSGMRSKRGFRFAYLDAVEAA